MSMIVLVPTAEPTESVCLEQAQVKVVWEGHNFGYGTLYITERVVAWISDRSEDGFTLTYPSIGVYGITSADLQNPDPSLFMVVDLNKTSIPIAQQSASNGSNLEEDIGEDEDLAEDGSRTATLRLIPEDANSLNLITGLMQQCHLMNPDADDEQADPDYSFADNITDHAENVEADDSWFTPETQDNEIRLSAEGRSNLERIVGDLHLDSPRTNQPNSGDHQDQPQNHDEDEMDHA